MKIKKLIAMVLTWSLLLCLYSPASATQASNAHSLEPSIQNQMLRILLSIEKDYIRQPVRHKQVMPTHWSLVFKIRC